MERRLAAILVADVVAYSRLMEEDEAATMVALGDRRQAVWEPLLAKYRGRIIRTKGDSTLAEFASAVDAVQCAVDVQKAMKEANTKVSDDRAIILRIGLNLGDVMVEDGDLYGDGVNVAARLEAMADPGAICLSAAIHQQVERLLPYSFKDLGNRTLKNIARPLHVYAISADNAAGERESPINRASSIAGRPSIAVLPFTNLSGNPEQQYFSDGVTEDIIAELSRFRQFFVIARHSSFQFRDSAADVRRVGRELGVRYIVEGSVKRSGERIRITTQLIDALDGTHLWAERYDRGLDDIFVIQDEVVQAITRTFVGRLEFAAKDRAKRQPTNNLAAYDCFLRAQDQMWRVYYDAGAYYDEGTAEARRMCERAIQLDPGYARPYAGLALIGLFDWFHRGRAEDLSRARSYARTAVSLDDGDDYCHAALGGISQKSGEYDLAEFHLQKAVALNPNDADTICYMGIYLAYAGQSSRAIEWLENAMRRNPLCPDLYYEALGFAFYVDRRFADGVATLRRMQKMPSWCRAYLAACYAQLGQEDDARREIAEYILESSRSAENQNASGAGRLDTLIAPLMADLLSQKNQSDIDLWLDGLRKAGLPV